MINSSAVRCEAPSLHRRSRHRTEWTQLRLTLDGSLVSPAPLSFIFHELDRGPAVERIVPDAAALDGGTELTLWGSNLLPGQVCRRDAAANANRNSKQHHCDGSMEPP